MGINPAFDEWDMEVTMERARESAERVSDDCVVICDTPGIGKERYVQVGQRRDPKPFSCGIEMVPVAETRSTHDPLEYGV